MKTISNKLLAFALAGLASAASLARAEVDEGSARNIPWSGYWFPTAKGELLEPLRKYDALTGSNAFRWEITKNPPGANVPGWHGYCHGWAAAAVLEREPAQPLTARGAGGNVPINVGDQKGWYAACHSGDAANWFGDRYGDGQGTEDPADLRPDMLWQLLKLFIKDQGVPLIMDLDPGPEVWNYPVYAYRIEYRPLPGADGWNIAQLSLWAADDAVPPDFVGLVPHFQTYTFQFQSRGRAVIAGSASWVGQSVGDHPDFAWYPYVVRSDNPELQPHLVRQLIQGGSAAGGTTPSAPGIGGPGSSLATAATLAAPPGALAGSAPFIPGFSRPGTMPASMNPYHKPQHSTGPSPSAPVATAPQLSQTPTIPQLPGSPITLSPSTTQPTGSQALVTTQPVASAAPTVPSQPSAASTSQPVLSAEPIPVSPVQLVAAVANRTSQFELDLRAAEFGKTQYAMGESLKLAVSSSEAGYLYLLLVDPVGELKLLYPRRANEDNRIMANVAFSFPPGGNFEIPGPLGSHVVKAIVTRQPLLLTGLTHEAPLAAHANLWQPRSLRLCPTQTAHIKSLLQDLVQGKSVSSRELTSDFSPLLTDFAQDELTIYVGPAR